jgi:tRNA (cytidine32/uridine32-2'-O)-methyltransferase
MPQARTTPAFGDLQPGSGPRLVVVLVEPSDARNIGAVARAMSNLATTELRLVTPQEFDATMAFRVACWGGDVILERKTFDNLGDAVADCHEVVGFASDSSSHRVPQLLLEEWAAKLEMHPEHRVALVFGSEENGLRKEHFPLSQFLIRIPSSTENPSYNLAQAVLLALYTIRIRAGNHIGASQPEWPVSGQLEPFTMMVLSVAERVGFLNQHSPDHIRDLLVNLTRRGKVSTRELTVLTGLVGMINKKMGAE